MLEIDNIINIFIVLWAVIDPIGTVPVFIAVTKGYDTSEKKSIAKSSSIIAFVVLILFLTIGEVILRNMGVPLSAFQTSGGVILFLFAINMIFGDSKPEEEINMVKNSNETAVFPLAIPSIASPGAILAVVLLSESSPNLYINKVIISIVILGILFINYILMRLSDKIQKKIGNSGAIVISKIMGLILASMAANNILMGIKAFFKL